MLLCSGSWCILSENISSHLRIVVTTRIIWRPSLGRDNGRWCHAQSLESCGVTSWAELLSWSFRQFCRVQFVGRELSLLLEDHRSTGVWCPYTERLRLPFPSIGSASDVCAWLSGWVGWSIGVFVFTSPCYWMKKCRVGWESTGAALDFDSCMVGNWRWPWLVGTGGCVTVPASQKRVSRWAQVFPEPLIHHGWHFHTFPQRESFVTRHFGRSSAEKLLVCSSELFLETSVFALWPLWWRCGSCCSTCFISSWQSLCCWSCGTVERYYVGATIGSPFVMIRVELCAGVTWLWVMRSRGPLILTSELHYENWWTPLLFVGSCPCRYAAVLFS